VQAPSELCDLPEPLFNRLPVMHIECNSNVIQYHQASSSVDHDYCMVMSCSQKLQLTRYCHLRAVSAIASRPQSPHLCLNVAVELHLWMDHSEEFLALKYALLQHANHFRSGHMFLLLKLPPENVVVSFFLPLPPPNSSVN